MKQKNVAGAFVYIALLYLCIAASICYARDGKVTFQEQPGKVLINIDGKTIATYVYEDPKILRPYFTNLKAPSGVQVTRHHPPSNHAPGSVARIR